MTSRRGFLKGLGAALAGFAILPSAVSYQRRWVAPSAVSGIWTINPEWVAAPYEVYFWYAGGTDKLITPIIAARGSQIPAPQGSRLISEPFPPRFWNGEGKPEFTPPYIFKRHENI